MTLVINPISVPIQIGCYREDTLLCQHHLEGKASDVLLRELEKLLDRYPIRNIIYASGPGSYMAIKLTYVALATLQALRDIPFAACSVFPLIGNRPVRAMGLLYFVKEKETIITQKFDEPIPQEFGLPDYLGTLELEPENTPLYILPAVQR